MITSGTTRNILNFIMFQIGWFACVTYPDLLGPLLVLVFLVIHFIFVSQNRFTELQFIGLGTVVGALLDGFWFRLGILDDGSGAVLITPPWLVAIWAIFMTTLSHSLNWISRKVWLAFLFAPIAGPFTYWSATKIGVVELPELGQGCQRRIREIPVSGTNPGNGLRLYSGACRKLGDES